jgi:eukaryotic-like serine/threonine-protein kinase
MRLRVLIVIGLVLVASQPTLCDETSMFRGDPQHTGVYASAGITEFHRVKWRFHAGGMVIASPAVVGDTVFVGSTDGNLYAIDRDAGTLKWKFATKGRVVSSAAVANGVVYFGSYDGNFYALDARSGKLEWKFTTAGERRFEGTHLHGAQPAAESMPDPFDVYLSSPTIWHDTVYFGSGDGNIYALDAGSGALDWKFKTGDVVHASPAIADGTVYVGSWDSYFYALDATSGVQRWRFKTGDDPDIHNQVGIQSSAAVIDGIVFFGCRDSHLYALNAGSGQKLWSFPTSGSWVVASPAVRDGMVYFATSDSGLFYAVKERSGDVTFSLKFHGWPTFASPAIAGDMLYLGSWSGKLTAIDLQKQKVAWTFATDGATKSAAAYTKPDGSPNYEAAYASNFYDDIVVGFSKMMSVGSILSSPVIADRVIYVGSADGNVYALE